MRPGIPPAFLVSAAFIAGTFVGSFAGAWFVPAALFVASGAIVSAGVFRRRTPLFFAAALLVAAFGSYRTDEAVRRAVSVLARDGVIEGEAVVVAVPKRTERYQEVTLRFRTCGDVCPSSAALARLPLSERYRLGDRMRVTAMLDLPENRSPDFDYRMYLAKNGIGYIAHDVRIGEVVPSPVAGIFAIAERFEDALAMALPEPESSLAAGLILGGEGRLPETTQESFRVAGLSHIVALSGFNIAIVSFYFLGLGVVLFLRRRQAAIFAVAASAALVIVAGLPPSGLRALGMAAIMILALGFGRRYGSVTALAVAAAVMLSVNPLLLRYDIGFQLSVLATLGIILSMPIVGMFLDRLRYGRIFAESALLTVAAELFILPIVLSVFGEFSLVAIVSNAVLIPIVPVAMLFSSVLGFGASVLPAISGVFAVPAYLPLHAIAWGAEFAAAHPVARITLDSFGWIAAAAWYGALAAGFLLYARRSKAAAPDPLPHFVSV